MSKNTRRITYTAIAAAIVFVVTRVTYIPVGTAGAYVHFGDAFIYFTAFLLGGPIAAIAAALGSAICDLSTGYTVYVPATFLIKGLMGLTAGLLIKNRKFWVFIFASAVGGAIMTAGYALYEICIPGFGPAYALFNIPFNMGQWGASIVIAAILYPVAIRIQKVIRHDELK
ncbi:MAG: ECF transporter S component [Clostridiales bacterium]|nr:ECF transporter S component [Clostridiales bacterium]